MAPKPAAPSRPSTAFRAGGVGNSFAAPLSNRCAAERRICTQGSGGSEYSLTPRSTVPSAVNASQVFPAGMRVAQSGEPESPGRGGGAGQAPLTRNMSNFVLQDASAKTVDASSKAPSVFSSRSKQAAYMPTASYRHSVPQSQQSQTQSQTQSQNAGEYFVTDATDITDPGQEAVAAPPPPVAVAEPPAAAPAAPPPPPPPAAAAPVTAPPQPINPADAHLGKGVFAKVRLTHGRDGQMVAVKTYDHKEAKSERAVQKHMINEEKLAGKLQHENIIAPQVARKGGGVTELEMEYAPGGTLDDYLKKLGRPMREEEARKTFKQLVDAVHYLHETKGICHRDIKLENVVLDADGNARLVDFGAAKEGGAHNFLTSMQGTPAYMAPEVAQSRAHKGGPADVWALGVLLYNLVSGGAFPFWGKSMDELKRNITAAPPRLPAGLSPSCRDLLTKLLQKSSAIRLSVLDVRKHPWLNQDAPEVTAAAVPVGSAPVAEPHHPYHDRPTKVVNAAVVADAAAAASAYRGELSAARAAAAGRIVSQQQSQQQQSQQQQSQQQQPQQQPYQNAQYQYVSRNPITGGPASASRPSTANSLASPRSASKLAGLMNAANARPGTAVGASAGRTPSEAQLRGAYHRR
jgi:serine/threonine protein kinase